MTSSMLSKKFILLALITLLLCNIAYAQETNYNGYIWRNDVEDNTNMPRNFRTSKSNFQKMSDKYDLDSNYIPSRKGLDELDISGSAQFSPKQFKSLIKYLKTQTDKDIYIIDLRQETHGFFNDNTAVSWYGLHDWGNIDKTTSEIIKDERQRLNAQIGKTIEIGNISSDKVASTDKIKVHSAMTEKDLVHKYGLNYVRITTTDHIWPKPKYIDQFIDLYRNLPPNTWLHFHCEAGAGRTTEFMAMYDILKNPDIPLKDILYRQYLIGGNYVAYTVDTNKSNNWKDIYYNQKAIMIKKFYQYAKENHNNNYKISWSKWLQTH